MIGYLQGKVQTILPSKVIILTAGGVGYAVSLPHHGYLVGQDISTYVYTAVRENEISLWGFETEDELKLFEMLLDVSGIGLKTAFSLLGGLGVTRIVQAIVSADVGALKAPGVGRKTAERMVLELKDKLSNTTFSSQIETKRSGLSTDQQQMLLDATSALEGLGYRQAEIDQATSRLDPDDYADSQTLVKALLMKV